MNASFHILKCDNCNNCTCCVKRDENVIITSDNKKNVNVFLTPIEIYMKCIHKNIEENIMFLNNVKMKKDDIITPTIHNYDALTKYNYNIRQLKEYAKTFKIKISGSKNDLQLRLYIFLKLSSKIIAIQKIFRGYILRKYNKYIGPALFNRKLCTNETDFLTMDNVADLPYSQFFSFKDTDGFVYGFDIISLYNLIAKTGKKVKNPYNRGIIPSFVIHSLKSIIRMSKIFKIKINLELSNILNEITPNKNTELRTLDLFQYMDSLGNYSDPAWFLSLNKNHLIRFLRELIDIWNYRAQIPYETKIAIYPPTGDPFSNISFYYINQESEDNIRIFILNILEKMVNIGIDKDSKTLASYYILSALTLVNDTAAGALPWLFQSVSH